MKHYKHILSLLLAMTIAVISFYPCADSYASSFTTEPVFSSQVEKGHTDASDGCSPFCVCVCCAVSMPFTLADYTVPTPLISHTMVKTPLSYPWIKTIVYSIWQPPKLV